MRQTHFDFGKGADVILYDSQPLFAWDAREDSPTLRTIRQFIQTVPDGQLLAAGETLTRLGCSGVSRC